MGSLANRDAWPDLSLPAQSVAAFYARLMAELDRMDLHVAQWP